MLARSCSTPRCHRIVTEAAPCPDHGAKARRREVDDRRGSARERGYDSRWERARKTYMQAHPLCVRCELDGRVSAAIVLDHVRPHRGDKALFWDTSNWWGICREHDDSKRARENGIVSCDGHGGVTRMAAGQETCVDCGVAA